jgi:Restriction endonuclease
MASSFRAAVKRYLKAADQAKTPGAKGKAFEDLACYVFESIPGISVSHRNALNVFGSEEIDVAFWNEQHPEGLKWLEAFLLVECKNWSAAVGSAEVITFITKLRNRGLDFGILIAARGVTGNPEDSNRAHHQVSLALSEKIQLIVITRREIEGLKDGAELVRLIKRKVGQLIAIGTVWP